MTSPNTNEPPNPHFDRIGGEAAVTRLVEAFYRRMDTLPEAREIRAMHGADLESIKATFRLFLTEWLGGPKEYTPRHGHPRLRMRHARFPIGPRARDAWLLCMQGALEEVVVDPVLRAELEAALTRTANAVLNRMD